MTIHSFQTVQSRLNSPERLACASFHIDAKGFYIPGRGDAAAAELSPRLHGAMRTDAEGRYRYSTIRPGSYQGIAAHVHYVIPQPATKLAYLTCSFRMIRSSSRDERPGNLNFLSRFATVGASKRNRI